MYEIKTNQNKYLIKSTENIVTINAV